MLRSKLASPVRQKTEEPASSPAKPTKATPPRAVAGAESFKYYIDHRNPKNVGLTPRGTKKISLHKNQGYSHNLIRLPGDDTIFCSPNRDLSDLKIGDVLVAMKNLKDRADRDYRMLINAEHFRAARIKINESITVLKTFYNDKGTDKETFLKLLNTLIKSENYCNPFGLDKIYSAHGYKYELAGNADVYAAPIEDKDLAFATGKILLLEEKVNGEMKASDKINKKRKDQPNTQVELLEDPQEKSASTTDSSVSMGSSKPFLLFKPQSVVMAELRQKRALEIATKDNNPALKIN